jgi:hypothetical protein
VSCHTEEPNQADTNIIPILPNVRDFDELVRISETTGRPLPKAIRLHFSNEAVVIDLV